MSRLSRIGHGARSIARRVNAAGVARVVIAAGGASALVYLAATRPVDLDLVAAAGEDEVTVGGTALTTRVDASCPGPELTCIPGLPDVTVKGWDLPTCCPSQPPATAVSSWPPAPARYSRWTRGPAPVARRCPATVQCV
jgi:hypothetical protein